MMTAGQWLRAIRKSRKLTLREIAQKTGRSLFKIHTLEVGAVGMKVEEFIDLCLHGYDVDPGEYLWQTGVQSTHGILSVEGGDKRETD